MGALAQRLSAGGDLKGKNLLLDVRGEEQQVHQLRQPRAREAVLAGDVGLVVVDAGLDLRGDVVGERETLGNGCGLTFGARLVKHR